MLISKFQRKSLVALSAAFVLLSLGDNPVKADMTAACTLGAVNVNSPTTGGGSITCDVDGTPNIRGGFQYVETPAVDPIDSTYVLTVNVFSPSKANKSSWVCNIGQSGPAQGHGWPANLTVNDISGAATYSDNIGRATGDCTFTPGA
ncbi:MAG: hypothetical protein HYX35_00095 [Proteobacteria bacterium]|nr:hypothetical protein [Pseudomonadota bacterium]